MHGLFTPPNLVRRWVTQYWKKMIGSRNYFFHHQVSSLTSGGGFSATFLLCDLSNISWSVDKILSSYISVVWSLYWLEWKKKKGQGVHADFQKARNVFELAFHILPHTVTNILFLIYCSKGMLQHNQPQNGIVFYLGMMLLVLYLRGVVLVYHVYPLM